MLPEEFDAVELRRRLSDYLKAAKLSSIQSSKLRNALATELDVVVIVEELDKSWDKVKDLFFKHLAETSLMKKDYTDWLKQVTVRPLLTPKPVPKIEEEAVKEDLKDKKKDDKKKDDGKDKKKTDDKKKEDEQRDIESAKQPSAPKELAYIEAKDLLSRMEDKLNVRLEYFKAVNVLDAFAEILDKHRYDFEGTKLMSLNASVISPDTQRGEKDKANDIDFFLDDIFNQVSQGSLGSEIKRSLE